MNKSLLGSKGKEKRGVCEKLPSKSLCHFDSYPSTTKWNHRKEISGICDRYGGKESRAWWPCGPRRGSAVIRLPGLRVRILSGTWMAVCCQCCVLSGKVLCFGPITSPEKSYRVWCVWVWPWSFDNEEALIDWGVGAVASWWKKRGRGNVRTEFLWWNMREWDRVEWASVWGRIILKSILKMWNEFMCAELMWVRIKVMVS